MGITVSKYESRAAEIKASAAEYNWKIQWRRIRHRIYVTVNTKQGNPMTSGPSYVKEWLREFYKDPQITSGGWGEWNYMVCDLIQALKGTGDAAQ